MTKPFEVVGSGWVRIDTTYLQTRTLSVLEARGHTEVNKSYILTKDKFGAESRFHFESKSEMDGVFKQLLEYTVMGG